jgi:hypothetical protein
MTIVPPPGPAGLPPPRRGAGRRLNRLPLVIFTGAGCIVAASVAYTLHERQVEQEWRRQMTEARPQSADAGGILKDAPSGYIKPVTFRPPEFAAPPKPPVPPKPFKTSLAES